MMEDVFKCLESNVGTNPWLSSTLLLATGSQWLDSARTQDAGITLTYPAAQSAMLEPLQHINYTKRILKNQIHYGSNMSVNYPQTPHYITLHTYYNSGQYKR
jgi:hypothetical protein